jgi:hypothetical protein
LHAPCTPRSLRSCLAAASILLLTAGTALGFSFGPPAGSTNAPGESNCTTCHGSFPLNSGSGTLLLSGLPEDYEPDAVYDLTVTLSDPEAQRWGFQLTMLAADGTSTGQITVDDSGTQTSTSGDRTYLKQNQQGTAPGTTGAKSWTFQWTAPAPGVGEVTLHVAGNAADNDGGTAGDRIYADFFSSAETTAVPALDLPPVLVLHGAAPNPFNPATDIRFDLARTGRVRVDVLTVDGRRVATLADRTLGGGSHAVPWDGRNQAGRTMGSGMYLYAVEVDGVRQLGRMTLVK